MSSLQYDIAVVGGGLGGLCFSILAAKEGYSVVLFEKEKYPFHRVCGEYISLESCNFLNQIGVDASSLHVPFINKLELTDVKGNSFQFPLQPGGFGISRYSLDNLLYKIAVQQGVQILTGTKVTNHYFENSIHSLAANNCLYTAGVVINAYGKRSNLDVKFNRRFVQQKPDKLNNYIGVKYHIKYPVPSELISLHNFSNGYCGISNIEEGKCCLCYLTTASNLSLSGNSIQEMEEKLLFKNPVLKEIFSEAEFLYDAPLVISQVSFSKKSQIENHALNVGDSAGMITPLCGNGMSMAMHTAKIAFKNVNIFLKKEISRSEMESFYEDQWKKTFSRRLSTGRMVQKLFGNNILTSTALNLLHKIPYLSGKIINATHGESF